VAVATEGAASAAGCWAGGSVVVRSDVETWDDGATAIIDGGAGCWLVSEFTPDAGAVLAMGPCPPPVAFTGAESVA
jgi:hypothetical protein